jgi:hypothetical protein
MTKFGRRAQKLSINTQNTIGPSIIKKVSIEGF